ncbi:hypothetical protein Tco_1002510 [Tanacetum coccineum]|uniref:Uncharacterized protein n=1 Tax=Tanacetum coccineum TaxID=301880 RepID=A0ABQ5F8B6_9ASTR
MFTLLRSFATVEDFPLLHEDKIYSESNTRVLSLDLSKVRITLQAKALDPSLGTTDDTDIKPSYDTEPMVEVPYTAKYNVFAVESQHSEQPENMNDTSLMKKVDSNITPDSSDMCNNEFKDDQNADDHEDERVVLADLIANLKCDIDENKMIQKQLRNANTSLAYELEKCKSALEECKSSLGESSRTRDRYLVALHDKEIELAKCKTFKDHTIENDTLEHKLKETQVTLAQKDD